jgi:hypothetical protein
MFNRSKALIAAFIGGFRRPAPVPKTDMSHADFKPNLKKNSKGQILQAKSKASGAASLKRASTKRNNIRKHSQE